MEFEDWGKSVLEEVLFRAGLKRGDAGSTAEATEVSLSFQITASAEDGSLAIEFERIGGSPVTALLPVKT